jgi:hypothetical protein
MADGPFAGKPAPTVTEVSMIFVYNANPCGSGLAREGGVTGDHLLGIQVLDPMNLPVRQAMPDPLLCLR